MRKKLTAAVVIPVLLGAFAFVIAQRTSAAGATSQNGWTVIEESGTTVYQVPGSKVRLRLRTGDAAVVLLDVASWFDRHIEDIDVAGDDWGWSVRKIEGSDSYSNHASGTAIDLNAEKHPMGVASSDNLTAAQIDAIREQMRTRYQGVVRWGGDYRSRPDAMHFEINKDAATVKALAASLKGAAVTPVTTKPAPATTKAPAPTKPPTTKAPAPTTAAPAPSTAPPTTAPATTTPPTTTPPTTEAPTTVPPSSLAESAEHDDEGEDIGPVEPQAPVPAPLPAAPAQPVVARPSFTG